MKLLWMMALLLSYGFVYFFAWNVGFDLGHKDAQDEYIIRGRVRCQRLK